MGYIREVILATLFNVRYANSEYASSLNPT